MGKVGDATLLFFWLISGLLSRKHRSMNIEQLTKLELSQPIHGSHSFVKPVFTSVIAPQNNIAWREAYLSNDNVSRKCQKTLQES